MIEQQNPYNRQSYVGQPMVPPPPMPRARTKWQQRMLGGLNVRPMTMQQERTLPNWLINNSVIFFFVAFIACTVVWGYPMEMQYTITSSLSVLLFFYGSRAIINGAVRDREKAFLKNIFVIGFVVRLLWMGYCYFFYNPENYGNTYGDGADVDWYMPYGVGIAEWLKGENPISFSELMKRWGGGIDDVGYPFWLAILNILSFGSSDVFVPLVVKCIVNTYSAICIYHIAKRHFGEGTARIAMLFVAMNPIMIYWCSSMFKESEMVFLCCLCIDLVDRTFSSGSKLTFKSLLPGMLAGIAIFFFRAPLAIVIFLAMFAHIVMASRRVMSFGKKIIAGLLVAITLGISMGDRILSQTEYITESVQNTEKRQQQNLTWRAEREGGNSFAKYAGTAVFAPLIFTIPFPTFNMAYDQQFFLHQMAGGYYIKNIFSFFVIYVLIILILNGEWRRHVFILAYTLGYLVTLVLSNFAHSGRFHMPVWPMLMLLAAYGVQLTKTNPRIKRIFPLVLILEVMACLAWNWFKLKGRGMI